MLCEKPLAPTSEPVYVKRGQFAPELIYSSNCILEDTEPEPSGDGGLIDVAVVRAAYRAVETGRVVPILTMHRQMRPEGPHPQWQENCTLYYRRQKPMLHWSLVFLIIAIIAAVLGFGGIAGAAAGIAKILFFIFLVIWLLALVVGRRSI